MPRRPRRAVRSQMLFARVDPEMVSLVDVAVSRERVDRRDEDYTSSQYVRALITADLIRRGLLPGRPEAP